MRVAYRYIRPLNVVYARGRGPYETAAREAWLALSRWAEQHQARRLIKRGLGVFHDSPRTTAPDLLRYDACIELIPRLDVELGPGLGRQMLHGGSYAVHTHVGAYAPLGELFSSLHREWAPKQGLAVDYDRPFVAIYLNDPLVTREVHRRTEVCIPVLPVRAALSADGDGPGITPAFQSPCKALAG